MERVAWTDERLDDAFGQLRSEIRALRSDIRAMRSDLSAWQGQIAQIGWAFAAAVLLGLVALLVALL